jgi:hypothetical protein
MMAAFNNETIWRWLVNFWTVALLVFLVVNFLSGDAYGYLTPLLSIVYTAVLTLYVGTKEFERWYDLHESRHPGEIFIIIWTVVVCFMLAIQFLRGAPYKIDPEMTADYIMVLSIFAVTQKSKRLHAKRGHSGVHKHPKI